MSSSSNSKITDFIKVSEHLSIPFRDIKEATKDFTTLIGKDGYGSVYKGELLLSGGVLTLVAVKRLDCNVSGQGLKEFLTEIHLLSRYKHPNLVSLLGFCDEHGENILVYDYAEYGSLDKYLTKGQSTLQLTWFQRINICVDAARGLDYLHNHVAQDHRVIHRDVKSANVLLGQGWKAMIADFGLSKIGRANENVTFLITNASGTHGYCDPVYMDTGVLTKESDVYSFGVVLFEVLCGRLGFINVNSEQRFLAPLAKRYYENGRISEIIDPYLKFEVDSHSLDRFSEIAYQCLHNDRQQRPSMGLVVQKLEETGMDQAMKRLDGMLHVKVVRATKLKKNDFLGSSDPYVKLKLTEDKLPSKKTAVKYKNLNPEWNEEFSLIVKDPESQALEMIVYDSEQVGKHDKMGMNVVPLKELTPGEAKVMTLELLKNMDPNDAQNEKSRGQITIELLYKPFTTDELPADGEDENTIEKAPEGTPVGGGLLLVIIHQAEDLEGKHHTNPYVRVLFRGEEKKTKPVKKNRDPKWGEEFAFILEEPPTNDRMHFEVVSTSSRMGLIHPKMGKHDKMGMNVVPLKELVAEEAKVMTLELLKNTDPNDAQNEKSRGQITIELLYKPFTTDELPAEGEHENTIEKAPEGTPAGGGLLVVIIHQAEDLEGKHHTNPSVRVLFRGEEKKTKPVKKNRDPRWGEEFAFSLEEPPTNDRMHFEVVSTSSRMGLIHPKETLGYVDIQLTDVVSNKRINGKYNLIDSRNGTLQVELQWRTLS